MAKTYILTGTVKVNDSVGDTNEWVRDLAEEVAVTKVGGWDTPLAPGLVDYEISAGPVGTAKRVVIMVEAGKEIQVRFNAIGGTQFTMRGNTEFSGDVTALFVTTMAAGAEATNTEVDIVFAG